MHDSPGVLQAAYYLPDKVMTATDIRKAISSGRKAEVEAAVKQASAMLQQLQVSAGVSAKALGIFRTNCILWVVDKRHKEVCRIESIDHAGNLFIEMLKEMTGNSSIQSPWSSQQTSDTANVAPKHQTCRENHHVSCCYFFVCLMHAHSSLSQLMQLPLVRNKNPGM